MTAVDFEVLLLPTVRQPDGPDEVHDCRYQVRESAHISCRLCNKGRVKLSRRAQSSRGWLSSIRSDLGIPSILSRMIMRVGRMQVRFLPWGWKNVAALLSRLEIARRRHWLSPHIRGTGVEMQHLAISSWKVPIFILPIRASNHSRS